MDKYFAANATFAKFSKNYMELKKNLPIRQSEMGALNILASMTGPRTSVRLAEIASVSKPMVTAILKSLTKKGYVIKRRSEEDKRVYYLELTPKAMQVVEDAKAESDIHLEHIMKAMGQESFDKLIELTQMANDIMEADSQSAINRDGLS